jgi:pimeloyl-ACP methyl ester carboxylesterase
MRAAQATATAARVDGVNYSVTGDGEHAIVLLHGFADNNATWSRVVPRLAVEHRVIAIDLPGFGASTRPWTRPLLSGYVDVVREVLDAEYVRGPVSLMGNSMGAVVSLLFAGRYPKRADRVVLIDMPALRTVPRLWRLAMSRPAELAVWAGTRTLPDYVAQFGLGWFYARFAAADPRRLDPMVRQSFVSPYARDRIAALLPLGRALLDELSAAQLASLASGAGVPVLLVFGSRDLLTPARVLRRIARPAGRAVVLPGCGHCPQVDQPAELLCAVLPFLSER